MICVYERIGICHASPPLHRVFWLTFALEPVTLGCDIKVTPSAGPFCFAEVRGGNSRASKPTLNVGQLLSIPDGPERDYLRRH